MAAAAAAARVHTHTHTHMLGLWSPHSKSPHAGAARATGTGPIASSAARALGTRHHAGILAHAAHLASYRGGIQPIAATAPGAAQSRGTRCIACTHTHIMRAGAYMPDVRGRVRRDGPRGSMRSTVTPGGKVCAGHAHGRAGGPCRQPFGIELWSLHRMAAAKLWSQSGACWHFVTARSLLEACPPCQPPHS